jgi:hypothetical protein
MIWRHTELLPSGFQNKQQATTCLRSGDIVDIEAFVLRSSNERAIPLPELRLAGYSRKLKPAVSGASAQRIVEVLQISSGCLSC